MPEPTTTAAAPECEPPCPVAEGAMGLLCTCGNVVKRWNAINEQLRADLAAVREAEQEALRRA